MRPLPCPAPSASCRRASKLGEVALLALLATWAAPALAQVPQSADAGEPDPLDATRSDEEPEQGMGDSPSIDGPSIDGPSIDGSREIAFEAEDLQYDSENDAVLASGNVVLREGDRSVRADSIRWDRKARLIQAIGNVRFVDADGNQLYATELELTDKFEAGALEDLLLTLREGGRLAAESGERGEDGQIMLRRAVYSACQVSTPDGCPKQPSWKISAERVVYDPENNRVRFSNGFFSLFGQRILPLPNLELRTDGGAASGFLVPDLRISQSNGIELRGEYYWRLAENRDLQLGAYLFSEAPPMAQATYRELGDKGAFQATGYITASRRLDPFTLAQQGEQDIRGFIDANGRYQFDQNWSLTGSIRRASDRTFLRRYDINRDDRLRSIAEVERVDKDSYLIISGYATQTLRLDQRQGEVPLALPLIDFRQRIDENLTGGQVTLRGNTLAITRQDGQDTQRAFASAEWKLRRVTGLGQVVDFVALARGDVYHSRQNALTQTVAYRGTEGWESRAIALGAVDVSWPLVGPLFGGSQVLTPRVQIVATPPIRNAQIPNEDSRAIDLEDTSLFALNRFPGEDRFEDGVRVTYGADWELTVPDWRVTASIGQSYRLDDKPVIFPDGTGLSERFSDIVGRTRVRYKDLVSFTYRFRLDKDNLAPRRTEIDATVGNRRTYVEVGYLRLDRNIPQQFEDLGDREELRFAGRLSIAQYWSIFGAGVVNMTGRDEDPTLLSDGFEPIRTRVGIAYQDECIELGLTWRRDFVTQGDALRGDTIEITFELRNLGFR